MAFLTGGILDFLSQIREKTEGGGTFSRTTSSLEAISVDKIGAKDDAAAMNTTLYAGQQAIYNDVHGVISLGSELVTNGNFAAWTGDDPNGWTVAGETDANNKVTENSGACRIYAVANHVYIRQDILTAGKFYFYSIGVTDVSAGSICLYNGGSIITLTASAGTYSGYFVAEGAQFWVSRYTNPCDVTFDNVSVKEVFLSSSNVPAADATVNTTTADVIGNKSDAAVTTVGTVASIVGYVKGILTRLAGVLPKLGTTTAGTIVQDGTSGTPNIVAVQTSGSGANTFGSWTELDASVAADIWISHVTVSMDMTVTGATNYTWCVEIGTGASSSEAAKIRFSGYHCEDSAVGHIDSMVFPLPIPIKVSSGTRIAARVSNSTGNVITFEIGISFYTGLEA